MALPLCGHCPVREKYYSLTSDIFLPLLTTRREFYLLSTQTLFLKIIRTIFHNLIHKSIYFLRLCFVYEFFSLTHNYVSLHVYGGLTEGWRTIQRVRER